MDLIDFHRYLAHTIQRNKTGIVNINTLINVSNNVSMQANDTIKTDFVQTVIALNIVGVNLEI